MNTQQTQASPLAASHALTLRDILIPIFRHLRLVTFSFLGILLGVLLSAVLLPRQYLSQMKILVKHGRVDPLVTSERNPQPQFRTEITDEELNSEVEILKSRDLLGGVVLACQLHRPQKRSAPGPAAPSPVGPREAQGNISISRAVLALEKQLQIEPLKKTSMIKVAYESPDPELAARVLSTLANLYLEKHVALRRPPGAFDFFQQETRRYLQELTDAEARLNDFSQQDDAVAAQLQRDQTLQKLNDADALARSTRASISEAERRIRELQAELAASRTRVTTQLRSADNPALPQLQSTLLNLELKRTELTNRFEPEYPLVKEIESQIARTRSTIQDLEKLPIREETTDRDPGRVWLEAELTKSKTELAALRARATAEARIVAAYREQAQLLDRKGTLQQGLIRNLKAAEENYLLYLRKREEARITDALDRQRIINVALAEAPTVPLLPSRPQWPWTILVGMVLASVVSLTLAFVADYLNPAFRSPDELQQFLNLPVLAAVPATGK